MPLPDLLAAWRDRADITANVTAWRTEAARPGHTAPLPPDLHPALAERLATQGIIRLYSHQAAAWQQISAGHQPIIVTGTASGKSLGYNLPVLDSLLHDTEARALYLFPTKALAHDQAEALARLLPQNQPASFVAAYDGDTPAAARPAIRRRARVIISNPDMLHTAILPHHTRWADFFGHLRFVIIDEMHIYRGVFGSHVANVIRRLKRIAHFHGAAPHFILTSATIANPLELAERLIEAPVVLVDDDGAPRGERHFLIYNPPIVNPEFGIRRSALRESVRLSHDLLAHDVQSLVFGRTRRTVEMLLTYLREGQPAFPEKENPTSSSKGKPVTEPIRAYRSGYLPRHRRQIEQGLRTGRVRTVVTTNALELGIDLGGLDGVILAGYPGTIAGTWQQTGRAGRQQSEALAVLVTSANPLDQFLAHHPAYFFERSPEQALINPDNLLILLQHIRCAAFELPFAAGDNFGRVEAETVTEFLRFLTEAGELHAADGKYFWLADRYPAQAVSLRSASPERISLLVRGNAPETTDNEPQTTNAEKSWRVLGDVDRASAPWLVHPQAVYLHEGQSYVVEQLDLADQVAYLTPTAASYYTEPRRETTVEVVAVSEQMAEEAVSIGYGELLVTTQVTGYKAIRWFTQERVGEGEVSLPPSDLQTSGYWLALSQTTVEQLRTRGVWRSDQNDYGPNWAQQRNQARARDGYRCRICDSPETERQHDVHHKQPFRTFASYKEANRLDNVVTLCRACHRRAETAVKVRSGLSGLATLLGHLAPLFVMCDAHDIAVHSDPHSPLTDGQPTVVIYELIPAGLGFSQRLFERHAALLDRARELVVACPCAEGCPSCVGPAGEAGEGGKAETLAILEALTAQN